MSAELIGILAVGVALAGLILQQNRVMRQEVAEIRRDLAALSERVARIEGAVLGPWRPEAEKEG